VPTTTNTLLNQVSPVLFEVNFQAQGSQTTAQYQVGPAQFSQSMDAAALQAGFRAIDANTVLGKCMAPQLPALAQILLSFSRPVGGGAELCFLLTRA